jgi:uncharacterized protein (TIGR03067 family)
MEQSTVAALAAGLIMAAEAKTGGRTEIDNLQGEWVMVSRECDGEQWPAEEVKKYRRTIKGYRYLITRDGTTVARGILIPDGARTPAAVDVIQSAGANRGQVRLGIYELDGPFQQVCLGAPNGARPTEFTSWASPGRWLTIWKRVAN